MSPWRMALPAASLGAAFALAAAVEPWYQTWAGTATRQGNALQVLLGDSRRMFANHFYVKADAYFHSGYYPSVFDNRESFQTAHMAADAGAAEEKNTGDEHAFLGPPRDWIDAFSRHLFPSQHTHLDEGGAEGHDHDHAHDHDHDHAPAADDLREILPWLRMSVELDPHRVESYMVAAYWLRERMERVDEAEQFLREGLRVNPNSYEILFELGRCAYESRQDPARARILWDLAYQRWHKAQATAAEPDLFMLRQILSYRALLDEREGRLAEAIEQLKVAREASGGLPIFDQRIARLEEKRQADAAAPAPAGR